MTKRILSILVAVLMVMAIIPVSALAANADGYADIEPVVFSVSTVENAHVGDQIEIIVSINGDYASHGIEMNINYDPACLSFVSIAPGEILLNRPIDSMPVISGTSVPGSVKTNLICPSDPFTGSGVWATITFEVLEGCVDGTPVSLSVNRFFNWPLNGELVDIPYTVTNGAVYLAADIPGFLLGDANCDEQVTMADVTALIAKVMNAGDLSEQGMINADANQDGEVNILDAAAIYAIAFAN